MLSGARLGRAGEGVAVVPRRRRAVRPLKALASIALLALTSALTPVDGPRGLCAAGEQVVFDCDTGRQRVAVCVGARSVQYRAGLPGRIALASPPRSAKLSYANRSYSGGGEAQVTFATGRYAYTVYSNVIRTNFGADGRHDPAFGAGVIVSRDGKPLSPRRCVAPADATLDLTLAMKRLPEGDFVEHD